MTVMAYNIYLQNKIKYVKIFFVLYLKTDFAGVSELADETDSKSVIRKGVWVRVPPPAPKQYNPNLFPIGDGFGLFVCYAKANTKSLI